MRIVQANDRAVPGLEALTVAELAGVLNLRIAEPSNRPEKDVRILRRSSFAYGLCGRYTGGPMDELTRVLNSVGQAEAGAAQQLFRLIYDELRRMAAQRLAVERPGQTLQATALVHEAFLRLMGGSSPPSWEHRAHFFVAAAEPRRCKFACI